MVAQVSSALGAFIAAAAFDQKGAFSLAIVTMAFCMLAGGTRALQTEPAMWRGVT